jgi:hypothetical protein
VGDTSDVSRVHTAFPEYVLYRMGFKSTENKIFGQPHCSRSEPVTAKMAALQNLRVQIRGEHLLALANEASPESSATLVTFAVRADQ